MPICLWVLYLANPGFSTHFFIGVYYNLYHVQLFQLHLHCVPLLRAQPQRAAAHPPQRIQARGCARARRRVRSGVLLHLGLRGRHARFDLNNLTFRLIIYNARVSYKFLQMILVKLMHVFF